MLRTIIKHVWLEKLYSEDQDSKCDFDIADVSCVCNVQKTSLLE